jgi:hypothetical protein
MGNAMSPSLVYISRLVSIADAENQQNQLFRITESDYQKEEII